MDDVKGRSTNQNGAKIGCGGGRTFKFVDCTQDAADAVAAASKIDDLTPDGYGKYAKSDCGFVGCDLISKHPFHYHCLRQGCGLGIAERSRLATHTDLHLNQFEAASSTSNNKQLTSKKLPAVTNKPTKQTNVPMPSTVAPEALTGAQQQQEACNSATCEMAPRGPHYHCAKCKFWAIDTTKMAIHRKQHFKQDQVAALGFEKGTNHKIRDFFRQVRQ